jgi:hypothetical protein
VKRFITQGVIKIIEGFHHLGSHRRVPCAASSAPSTSLDRAVLGPSELELLQQRIDLFGREDLCGREVGERGESHGGKFD